MFKGMFNVQKEVFMETLLESLSISLFFFFGGGGGGGEGVGWGAVPP